ncbi:MAG: 2-dehydro-3-deoxygalactonokinase [Hyphomicrobiales bacterium]
MKITPDFVAVDWGTSRVRAWAMDGDGAVIGEASAADGMGTLAPEEFEPALEKLIADWLPGKGKLPIIACGMVGARGGWIEAPYVEVPASPPDAENAIEAPVRSLPVSMRILPGMCQRNPADVMRGEETQIAGLLARIPDYEGIVCLPGTHTKWVSIADGKVVGFQTFMTGELFSLLSTRSVLRLSVNSDDFCQSSFEEGVALALNRPEQVFAQLFSLRAESLLAGLSAARAKGRLSGLLIGLEVVATKDMCAQNNIVIVGTETLSGLYEQAISTQGKFVCRITAEELVIAGLYAAYAHFRGTCS